MDMKKRREVINNTLVFGSNVVKITKEPTNELFFEIRNEVTTDLAEAVSIMMKLDIKDVWNIEVDHNTAIDPEKCLYWLSGGNKEWSLLEHYNKPWVECYLDFQEEFGFMVIEIIKRSKTLRDIRNGFNKYLNLPTLYDFAISKGHVK